MYLWNIFVTLKNLILVRLFLISQYDFFRNKSLCKRERFFSSDSVKFVKKMWLNNFYQLKAL